MGSIVPCLWHQSWLYIVYKCVWGEGLVTIKVAQPQASMGQFLHLTQDNESLDSSHLF